VKHSFSAATRSVKGDILGRSRHKGQTAHDEAERLSKGVLGKD
jgi:hypothetical protein